MLAFWEKPYLNSCSVKKIVTHLVFFFSFIVFNGALTYNTIRRHVSSNDSMGDYVGHYWLGKINKNGNCQMSKD